MSAKVRAAFFDFGGVILSSPFEAFNGFEERNGLPRDFIRTVNATDPDVNAWARFERSEVRFDDPKQLEAFNAALIRLKDAVWAVRNDRLRTARAS